MILVRDVFHCKFGRGDEMVALMKQIFDNFATAESPVKSVRILTDASGPFFTVVTETVIESIEAHKRLLEESFARPEFGQEFGKMIELVDSGHRDYYNIAVEYTNG
jgi:hypothetical protein